MILIVNKLSCFKTGLNDVFDGWDNIFFSSKGGGIAEKESQCRARVSQRHACIILPATEAARVWSVFGLPGHPRQWPTTSRSFRWQTSSRFHQNQGKAGRSSSNLFSYICHFQHLSISFPSVHSELIRNWIFILLITLWLRVRDSAR